MLKSSILYVKAYANSANSPRKHFYYTFCFQFLDKILIEKLYLYLHCDLVLPICCYMLAVVCQNIRQHLAPEAAAIECNIARRQTNIKKIMLNKCEAHTQIHTQSQVQLFRLYLVRQLCVCACAISSIQMVFPLDWPLFASGASICYDFIMIIVTVKFNVIIAFC